LLDIVLTSARSMHELIEALLQFARLGRTAVYPEAVDMDRLVRELLTPLLNGSAQPVQLDLAPLGIAYADRQLIRQVWFNLLSNAIKFSARQPSPRIRIGCQQVEGEIIYSITDNGVGFDPRYASDLFGVFKRLHSATDFPGTGVGLAICQRILANHGGRIWAESSEGHGATFNFALPVAPSLA
ncbi:MAG TPA: ATP-binding protein, partial [Hymenobacter sp.]|nr:ATP-binding protein [Hymenobacter sp.]